MPKPRFRLSTLLVFVTLCALFLTVHRIPRSRYELPNIAGIYPDHCVRQPWNVYRGWPMYSRADYTALHLEHETGACKYDTMYYPLGLVVNSLLAVFASLITTGMIVCVPQVMVSRRERRVNQASKADE